MTRVVIYRARAGWRWRIVARNGRIIAASSEAFVSRGNARRNLYRVKRALYPGAETTYRL